MSESKDISDPAIQAEMTMALAADEVHVWRIQLSSVASNETRWRQILSEDECARASRFRFPKDREYFTATRALLRTLLARYCAHDSKAIEFKYSDKGKPSLQAPACDIDFNVSHSGDVAMLAFARERTLGVDVEVVREDCEFEAISRRFFSVQEQQQLTALPEPERAQGFFRCWTRKEAYIKAVGTGLSLPLHQFDVSLQPRDQNALRATRPDAGEVARWSLREIPAGDNYIAALCVSGNRWALKTFELPDLHLL